MNLSDIQSFMAIGAHCDDVDLRCGGTFNRLAREGKKGCYVVATVNPSTGSHFPVETAGEQLSARRAETLRAAEILGADRVEWLGFKTYYFSSEKAGSRIFPSFESLESINEDLKDATFAEGPVLANAPHLPRCVERMTQLIEDVAPQVIFTHSPDDRHPDHYAVARFVDRIIRLFAQKGLDIDLCFWEPGSAGAIAGFHPNLFVSLSEEDVRQKQRAIDCYISQFPAGFVNHFAAERTGAYGALVDVDHAEAFHKGTSSSLNSWKPRGAFFNSFSYNLTDAELYE